MDFRVICWKHHFVSFLYSKHPISNFVIHLISTFHLISFVNSVTGSLALTSCATWIANSHCRNPFVLIIKLKIALKIIQSKLLESREHHLIWLSSDRRLNGLNSEKHASFGDSESNLAWIKVVLMVQFLFCLNAWLITRRYFLRGWWLYSTWFMCSGDFENWTA